MRNAFDKVVFLNKIRELAGSGPGYEGLSWKELFRLDSQEFVKALYLKVLRRPADDAALSGYGPRAGNTLGKLYLVGAVKTSSWRQRLRLTIKTSHRRFVNDVVYRARTLCAASPLARRVASRRTAKDAFYLAFEERYRGSFEAVTKLLSARYLTLVKERLRPGAVALDLGCGRGEWIALLQGLGIEALGVDANPQAVALAKGRGGKAVCADAIGYLQKIPAGTIDHVASFHLIEHLDFDTLWLFFEQIKRVLKPGGLLLLETPNARNVLVSAGDFYRDMTHRNPIFPDTLALLLENFGFYGGVSFFSETNTLIALEDVQLDSFEDYINISRDMTWIGHAGRPYGA